MDCTYIAPSSSNIHIDLGGSGTTLLCRPSSGGRPFKTTGHLHSGIVVPVGRNARLLKMTRSSIDHPDTRTGSHLIAGNLEMARNAMAGTVGRGRDGINCPPPLHCRALAATATIASADITPVDRIGLLGCRPSDSTGWFQPCDRTGCQGLIPRKTFPSIK